jgi:hypothetical protein
MSPRFRHRTTRKESRRWRPRPTTAALAERLDAIMDRVARAGDDHAKRAAVLEEYLTLARAHDGETWFDARAWSEELADSYLALGRVDDGADYLENKQDYLGYPAFLKAGRPVASGLIDGTARWHVKDRMQVTGARWSLDGAEAVLRLRALAGNGDLDDNFTFDREQEQRRNHDSRYQQPQTRAA